MEIFLTMQLLRLNTVSHAILIFVVFWGACGAANLEEKAKRLEEKFLQLTASSNISPQAPEIQEVLSSLSTTYIELARKSENVSTSIEYLYKAANHFETYLQQPQRAIELYREVIAKNPEHEYAANASFKIGYIYHNTLRQLPEAEKAYSSFIEQYPKHQLVPDGKFEIENLGVDPKDILSRVQNKVDQSQEKSPE